MPRLDNDSTDIRHQLEFCLSSDNEGKETVEKPSINTRHNWSSFAAGAGLAAVLLVGAPLIYFAGSMFGLPQATPRPATIATDPTPVALSLPLVQQTMTRVPLPLVPQMMTRVPLPFPLPILPVTSVQMAKIPGLGAHRSTLTGVVDSQTLTASYYWTFVLRNQTNNGHEAQMQLQLPAGAVVSRATLWINGQPQEAAFNSTERVASAYSWIADSHRDPLLITQSAPDRVLIKASPVVRGHDMKLRIGMTVPLKLNDAGEASLSMPHVLDSNFAFDCKQDVHVASPTPLFANRVDLHGSQGKTSLLRGNIGVAELDNLTISVPNQSTAAQFATRATHSSPPAFIVATINTEPGVNHGAVNFTKTFTRPNCAIYDSTDAAYRLSYLWAHQEIERLATTDPQQAVELASVYREVSSVSGAVVMELASDYSTNGLDRSMYLSTSYAGTRRAQAAPKAMPMPVARAAKTANFAAAVDKFSTSDDSAGESNRLADASPVAMPQGSTKATMGAQGGASETTELQGATNGTIGPQAADATFITGVNTAGTVRVNNLKNIEIVLDTVAIAGEILLLICGVVLAISGFFAKAATSQLFSRFGKRFLLGVGLSALGLALPGIVNFIVTGVRDYNLFG